MKEWYVFRDAHKLFYAFGAQETAMRYLRYLNHYRAPQHHHVMHRIVDISPTPTIAEIESNLDWVDMEDDMKEWSEQP